MNSFYLHLLKFFFFFNFSRNKTVFVQFHKVDYEKALNVISFLKGFASIITLDYFLNMDLEISLKNKKRKIVILFDDGYIENLDIINDIIEKGHSSDLVMCTQLYQNKDILFRMERYFMHSESYVTSYVYDRILTLRRTFFSLSNISLLLPKY